MDNIVLLVDMSETDLPAVAEEAQRADEEASGSDATPPGFPPHSGVTCDDVIVEDTSRPAEDASVKESEACKAEEDLLASLRPPPPVYTRKETSTPRGPSGSGTTRSGEATERPFPVTMIGARRPEVRQWFEDRDRSCLSIRPYAIHSMNDSTGGTGSSSDFRAPEVVQQQPRAFEAERVSSSPDSRGPSTGCAVCLVFIGSLSLCFCLPLGVVSIIFAASAITLKREGKFEQASNMLHVSIGFATAAIFVGIGVFLYYYFVYLKSQDSSDAP